MVGWRKKDATEPTVYQQALGLLVRREHSRKELTRKLRSKGVDADEMDVALDTLSRQDFQNDERFAEALARTRAGAGHGPMRIRAELATHGLNRDALAAALETCEVNWDASAQGLIDRRYASKDLSDPVVRRKAVDFLLRRGFEQRTAYAVTRARCSDANADEPDA